MTRQEYANAKAYAKGKGVARGATWATGASLIGGPALGAVAGLAGYVSGMMDAAKEMDTGKVVPEPADGIRQVVGLDPKGRR